jgi:hypothetical protein
MYKSITFIIISLLTITGCARTPNNYQNTSQKINESNIMLYGKLSNINGEYSFNQFSLQKHDKAEPWVLLNSGAPLWNTSKSKDCVKSFTGIETDFDRCEDDNPNLFREFEISLIQTTMMAPFSFGLSTVFNPGAVFFQRDDFEKAYAQALLKVTFNNKTGRAAVNELVSSLTGQSLSLEVAKKEIKTKYSKDFKRVIVIDKFVDNSGLYIAKSINAKSMIRVSKNALEGNTTLDVKSGSLESLSSAYVENLANQIKTWNENASEFQVTCRKNDSMYNYSLKCPETLKITEGVIPAEIVVSINSANYFNVKPVINEFDENISVNTDNFKITLENKTSEFMMINSFSFYHNGQIKTVSGINKELPPFAVSSLLDHKDFNWKKNDLSHKNINRKLAARKHLTYGIAVKYTLINRQVVKTLYKTSEYKLLDLI